MRYRKKLEFVEAHVWHANGDHPEDACETFIGSDGQPFQGEGKVVRYYRDPDDDGQRVCALCSRTMHDHGWVDQGREGYLVHPGDFVVTYASGGHYAWRPELFAKYYEPVPEEASTT